MQLIWNRAALALRKKRLANAQKYIDRECVAKMHPYVPVARPWYQNAGKLRSSVKIPEAGKITYTAPFSRHDYYAYVDHTHGGNPEAKRLWFEVMKSKHREEIGQGAAELIGARFE